MFVNMIIRPPRAGYSEGHIPKEIDAGGKKYKCEAFDVYNAKGEKLSATFVEPANDSDRSGDTMPCVIYMHGNAGNKMEGLMYAQEVVS